MTKLGGWVGSVTRTIRIDFGSDPDLDPAYQWDTKCKLFSLAEVCALSNEVPVQFVLILWWPPPLHESQQRSLPSITRVYKQTEPTIGQWACFQLQAVMKAIIASDVVFPVPSFSLYFSLMKLLSNKLICDHRFVLCSVHSTLDMLLLSQQCLDDLDLKQEVRTIHVVVSRSIDTVWHPTLLTNRFVVA